VKENISRYQFMAHVILGIFDEKPGGGKIGGGYIPGPKILSKTLRITQNCPNLPINPKKSKAAIIGGQNYDSVSRGSSAILF
jgi:hypothetical protein